MAGPHAGARHRHRPQCTLRRYHRAGIRARARLGARHSTIGDASVAVRPQSDALLADRVDPVADGAADLAGAGLDGAGPAFRHYGLAPGASHPLGRNAGMPARHRLTPQGALDILESRMADVLAVHHVDHVFADVLGVVADSLERAHDPHDIESTADAARILHHERDALALDGFVFLVDHAILARHPQGGVGVHAREGIERLVHHLRDDAA